MLSYDKAECVCLFEWLAAVRRARAFVLAYGFFCLCLGLKPGSAIFIILPNPPYQAVITSSNQAVFKIHLFYTIRFFDKPFSTDLFTLLI
jgi:hypothetical protein